MEREKIKQAVYAAISKGSGIPCRDLKDEMRLEDCSIVDSFDFAELAVNTEKKLDVRFHEEAMDKMAKSETIGEYVNNACAALHV